MIGAGSRTKARRTLPVAGRLLVPLMGLFFLVYPISIVLSEDPTPARVLLTLGGATLFVAVFLWLMWMHEPLQLVPAGRGEILTYRATIVFLAVVAGVLSFTLGAEWRMLFFFHINVAAGLMLLKKDAHVTIAALAVITFLLGLSTGLAWLAVPAVVLGLWATGYVGQVATVEQLRAAREELAQLAVTRERLRIARDLHDLLGHSLTLVKLKSELAGKLLPIAPERAATEIRETQEVARQALHEVREAIAGYRKPTLSEELLGARDILKAAGIDCRIENDAGALPKSVEAILAWTVREGTTNVIRHSRARHCTIRLTRDHGDAEMVRAEVSDDGRGAVPAHAGMTGSRITGSGAAGSAGGSGLAGLAERVAGSPGAHFEAGPLPEGGFRLRVSLPLEGGVVGGKDERR
jgi:two-component system, NarL family, sensor histidine kinase DesK